MSNVSPFVIPGLIRDPAVNEQCMKTFYVYIMSNYRNGTLYIGVTSNLVRRVHEHRNNWIESFTKEYSLHRLVYYESVKNIEEAILREKRLKRWKRKWKLKLIESMNPKWKDLYEDLL